MKHDNLINGQWVAGNSYSPKIGNEILARKEELGSLLARRRGWTTTCRSAGAGDPAMARASRAGMRRSSSPR